MTNGAAEGLIADLMNVVSSPMIDEGLPVYISIQETVAKDVQLDTDKEFQKRYSQFYRINGAGKNQHWRDVYFRYMGDRHRLMRHDGKKPPTFDETVASISLDKCEASFASKMVATLDPNRPILDKNVLKVMTKYFPTGGAWGLLGIGGIPEKIANSQRLYERLCTKIAVIEASCSFRDLVSEFDNRLPVIRARDYSRLFKEDEGKTIEETMVITNTKKLDFLLWALGAQI